MADRRDVRSHCQLNGGLDLPAQWWILYRGYGNAALSVSAPKYTCMEMQLSQYQHQSTPVWKCSSLSINTKVHLYGNAALSVSTPKYTCINHW